MHQVQDAERWPRERAMRGLLALLLISACTPKPEPVLGYVPDKCEAKAKLPMPPRTDHRSIDNVIAWARAAGRTANAAIAERDACAVDYSKLRAVCGTKAGCIIPPLP